MKRILTSLCGTLLIGSLVYSTSKLAINNSPNESIIKSVSRTGTFFEGTVLSLNIIFLFVFLICILAIIKEEDKNEKKDHSLL